MSGHGGAGGAEQHLRPQVALVEQLNEPLVIGAGVGVGEDEAFELGFALEPRVGPVAEELGAGRRGRRLETASPISSARAACRARRNMVRSL